MVLSAEALVEHFLKSFVKKRARNEVGLTFMESYSGRFRERDAFQD